MKRILFFMAFTGLFSLNVVAQQQLESKSIIDGFYLLSMDKMLDTIAEQTQLHIVYDKDMVKGYSIVDHFFREKVRDVLGKICSDNGLHYWVESDKTIYIIRNPEDVSLLKKKSSNEIKPVFTITRETQENFPPVVATRREPTHTAEKQQPFAVSGRVIDQASGESLPSAIVRLRNSSIVAATNTDGYFTLLKVPADTCILEISYIGYQPAVYSLQPENRTGQLTIGLFSSVRTLTEVNIKDKKSDGVMSIDKRRVSVLQITPSKLDELPNIGEKDILRSFQLMPGISGSNESSSGAYVRGGTPDQNLVLFDGFTVYQVDHLYGFFSAFNANSVKDVTLYKGGFSAKYGGRLSSVTDIVGKEGNSKEANIGGDLSLLSANIFAEKPLNNKSTILFAYRHSYQGPLYNEIFNKLNSNSSTSTTNSTGSSSGNGGAFGGGGPGGGGGPPSGGGPPTGGGRGGGGSAPTVTTPFSYFYDLNAKYTYAPDQKNRFSWSLYLGNDNLDNSKIISLPSFITNVSDLSMSDKTTYGNVGSSAKWSRQWNSKLYSNTLISYSSYHSDRDNSTKVTLTDSAGTATGINSGTFEKNRLRDFSIKSDWEWRASDKIKLLYGGSGSQQNVSYVYSQNDTSTLINQNTQALTIGGYTEFEINATDKFQLKPGLRGSYYGPTGKFYFEPRLSATYTLTDRLTLKAATGHFNQFTNRVIREDILNGSRDFWVLSNGNTIPVSSANHFIGGISYEAKNFLIDIEGYYKTLEGLSQYSQREVGNARTNVSLEQHFYTGRGYTKGFEVLLQKTHGKYTGWLSYTFAHAVNNFEIYGGEYPASQDTRHELKLVNLYHYKRWTFSSTWIFATGKPYTAPLTSYTVNDYTGHSHTFLTISAENGQRLPSYHRLDAAVTYDLIKVDSRKVGSIGFSMFNIYDRANVWYKQYTIVSNQVITNNVDYLGFTPNITLSLKFK
ncbi:TonB-dependent receptor [Mucilaginibacter sp. HMF5004]|uniref:TonB-dependent receptor n=1 Tax=Mucilaginibacter rivuli TaxID=2857527 RepID=UPI001C5D2E06|nr:TonB-dependent receptor [Mucilaginibacter rivuli]MBW4888934.1 TonB-dependent receptor [Mucilaginibacter rivuli]